MKSKLLVLTVAPAMLIATARLTAADTSIDAASPPSTAKHHQEILARFDKDRDGKLNEEEKAAAKAGMETRKGTMKDEVLARFDANADGKLDDAERATAREAGQKRRGDQVTDEQRAKVRAEFEAFARQHDKDGDGKLSADERKAAREAFASAHPEAAARMREVADKDRDGTVSDQERRAAAKEIRKKRKGGGEGSGGSE